MRFPFARLIVPPAALVFVLCSLSIGRVVHAQPPQGGPPPPPPSNLQVLQKDTPRPDVVAVMRTFTTGLGVTCDFCHVQDGTGRNDFAKDDLPTKRAARAMLVMVAQINQAVAATLKDKPPSEIVKVECVTCHRGLAIPRN